MGVSTQRMDASLNELKRTPYPLFLALVFIAVAIVAVLAWFALANVLDAWWLIPGVLQGAGILLEIPLGLVGAVLLMVVASKTNRPWLWWLSLVVTIAIIVFLIFIVYLFWLLQDV